MPQLRSQLCAAAIAARSRVGRTACSKNYCISRINTADGFYASHLSILRQNFDNLRIKLQLASGLSENLHQRIDNILRLVADRENSAATLDLRLQSVTFQQQYYIIICEPV